MCTESAVNGHVRWFDLKGFIHFKLKMLFLKASIYEQGTLFDNVHFVIVSVEGFTKKQIF